MTLLQSPMLPNVVYLLLVGGLWLAATALVVPGSGVLEALAVMALAGAGVGMAYIPVNPWAVGALVTGAGFFGLSLWRRREALWLALAAVAISLGSAFLFRVETGQPAVHPLVAVTVSLLTVGFFWLAIRKALIASQARPIIDPETVVGQVGEARTPLDPTGSVYVAGELWTGRCRTSLPEGRCVRVVSRDGLILIVESAE